MAYCDYLTVFLLSNKLFQHQENAIQFTNLVIMFWIKFWRKCESTSIFLYQQFWKTCIHDGLRYLFVRRKFEMSFLVLVWFNTFIFMKYPWNNQLRIDHPWIDWIIGIISLHGLIYLFMRRKFRMSDVSISDLRELSCLDKITNLHFHKIFMEHSATVT